MQAFEQFWATLAEIAWGNFMVVLLIGAGLYFTIRCRFLPFRGVKHALEILRGRYDCADDPGEISHFQALTSALSATLGMGNISGVAIGIAMGGPGAVFWMWVVGIVGMSTKFFTCTLAAMYRKKNEQGIYQGGPMYFIEIGLGQAYKPLAIFFALCGMIGCLTLFQINQLSGLLSADYEINRLLTGFVCMTAVGVIILGGITRVGKVTSKLVPSMAILYFCTALLIVLMNVSMIPDIIASIFRCAFGANAIVGGCTGFATRQVIINGVRRAAFSNEAGLGTAPMAHGAAKTSEPVREGLVAMLGPFIDTNIVCTLTALVILSTGVGVEADGVLMTANAFTVGLGQAGRTILTITIVLFALSTMISYSYYGLKCARYLFGAKYGNNYIYLYLLSMPIAAVLEQETIINIVDSNFAFMALPTLAGAILLSGRVMRAIKSYYRRTKL